MMERKKSQKGRNDMKNRVEKNAYGVLLAALAALAGLIIYIYTSVTGYLASSAINYLPFISTAAAVILMLAVVFMRGKISDLAADIIIFAAGVLILFGLYEFVLGRVSLAADVYFIPVNYPASEAEALHMSIAGVVLYIVSDILLIVTAFMKRTEAAE